MRAPTRAFRVLFLCCLASAGCMEVGDAALEQQDPKAPGEALGFFAIDGRLSEDSCGSQSLGAPEEWSFEVKLSRDGSTLYWLNGREAIVGEIDKSGSFAFETHVDLPLSEPRGAFKGCTIVRRDSAVGSLASKQASLSAKLSYGYQAKAGSDCSEYVTGTSGMPEALPCKLTYTLQGEKRAED
jgi:hypothetical protein